jgi:hypothetical protein
LFHATKNREVTLNKWESIDSQFLNTASILMDQIQLPPALALVVVLLAASSAYAQQDGVAENSPREFKITDRIPFGHEPVDYFGKPTDDAISKLSRRLATGDVRIEADSRHGYLKSVLKLLDVPLESQLLVYSKTARAPDLVSPKSPRALFFNDEVSVAWIPKSRELEITALDPVKGINFYTLSQPLDSPEDKKQATAEAASAADPTPTFLRRDRCLACHAGRSSLEVPGLLLRAFQTDREGKPIVGFSRVTHDMTYLRRWGGWYVTGSPDSLVHRGNLTSKADNVRQKSEPGFTSSLSDLSQKLDVGSYPYPKSDLVAHLVHAHQVHGTNLLIRASMESRLNRRSDVESELIRYFVFADEPPLDLSTADASTVLLASKFAKLFVARGPRDDRGNTLRNFSLDGRVFKHRLSYLIHSRMFDALPGECRTRLLRRLWTGLTSKTPDDDFSHLGQKERASIVAIVRGTVPRLPTCWSEE